MSNNLEVIKSSEKIPIQFTEDMHGFFDLAPNTIPNTNVNLSRVPKKSYVEKFQVGQKQDQILKFRLTIVVDDVDTFCNDKNLTARAEGYVDCPALGGKLNVINGTFNLFTRELVEGELNVEKEMHYRLVFKSSTGETYTFFGFKSVDKEDLLESWHETTTLYTTLFYGQVDDVFHTQNKIYGQGVLHLNIQDFMTQMTTFKSVGHSKVEFARALTKFLSLFATNLWEAYAPAFFFTETYRWNEHLIPLGTDEGVRCDEKSVIRFNTQDGLRLEFSRFSRKEKKSNEVVMLLHGLTSSTDMYIMPEHYNLTQYLLDHGYDDVWALDWRGSGRFLYNLEPHRYTMDYIAKYDVPAAIDQIIKHRGADVKIHVIAHCVGSLSFMCALGAGYTKNIASVVANSVSLNPKVSWQAHLKLIFGPFVFEHLFNYPYFSPKMPYFKGIRFGKWVAVMERMLRHECKEPSCHMVSFMWGWGFPAAYRHENLNPVTHRRLQDLFGGTSFHYFRHVYKMVKNGSALPFSRTDEFENLPPNYFDNLLTQKNLPPILLISGSDNHIFPGSNRQTFENLKAANPSMNVRYQEYPGYGHQDVFIGCRAAQDIFPSLLKFMSAYRSQSKPELGVRNAN